MCIFLSAHLYPSTRRGTRCFVVSCSLCFVLNLRIVLFFTFSRPFFYREIIISHDTKVPNQGTHYSKKWCKVTDFLPNNIFLKGYFFTRPLEKPPKSLFFNFI
jgi:hypothetical protein